MSWPNHLTKLSNESYKHFIGKAILFWILRDMNHYASSEWKVPNGYVDLCDKTTRTLYEIEFHVSKSYRNLNIDFSSDPSFLPYTNKIIIPIPMEKR